MKKPDAITLTPLVSEIILPDAIKIVKIKFGENNCNPHLNQMILFVFKLGTYLKICIINVSGISVEDCFKFWLMKQEIRIKMFISLTMFEFQMVC